MLSPRRFHVYPCNYCALSVAISATNCLDGYICPHPTTAWLAFVSISTTPFTIRKLSEDFSETSAQLYKTCVLWIGNMSRVSKVRSPFQNHVSTKQCINYLTIHLAFSPEYLDLAYNTCLKVLSLSRCRMLSIRRDCLSMISQISSHWFQKLHISFVDIHEDLDSELDRHRQQLMAIDEHLQHSNFVNFKCLTIGVPDAFRGTIKDYFPRNTERGTVRVTSAGQMERFPSIANLTNSLRPWRLCWQMVDQCNIVK